MWFSEVHEVGVVGRSILIWWVNGEGVCFFDMVDWFTVSWMDGEQGLVGVVGECVGEVVPAGIVRDPYFGGVCHDCVFTVNSVNSTLFSAGVSSYSSFYEELFVWIKTITFPA